MSLEEEIAHLNQAYFFREFTYSKNTFSAPSGELELADSLLWIDDLLVISQLKERQATDETTESQERRWFERTVLTKATKQIRDSLKYLNDHPNIAVENHRGHQFEIKLDDIRQLQKLIVFKPHDALPLDCIMKKYHTSSTAGIIHVIPAQDYIGIIKTLLSPAEFMDYLQYRAELITLYGEHLTSLPEQALVGHYILGDLRIRPQIEHAQVLHTINHDIESWDISGIITRYADRIVTSSDPTEHYAILRTLAKLRRGELKNFKLRYSMSLDNARLNEIVKPYRMALPRLDCGFVFIPVTQENVPHRSIGLQNLTLAHKYDLHLSKCIGISFARDGESHYLVEWCYIDYPWEYEEEMATFLSQSFPFRPVREAATERFDTEQR